MTQLFIKFLGASALLSTSLIPGRPVSSATIPLRVTVFGKLDGFGQTPIVGIQNEDVDVSALLSPGDFRIENFPASGTSGARAYLMPLHDIPVTVFGSQSGTMNGSLLVLDIIVRQLGTTHIFDQLQFRNYIPFATGTTLLWMEPRNSNYAARTGPLPGTVEEFFALFEKILKDGVNWRAATIPQFAATNGVRTGTVGIRNAIWSVAPVPEPTCCSLAAGSLAIGFLRLPRRARSRAPVAGGNVIDN